MAASRVLVVATVMMLHPWVSTGYAQQIATTNLSRTRETHRVTVNVDDVPLITVVRLIAREAGLVPVFNEAIIPAHLRVTLHVSDVAVPAAFQQALQGTGLIANVHAAGNVTIVRDPGTTVAGTVVGKVIDAKTKRPLRMAKVGLDGRNRAETAEDGSYRLSAVSAGNHILTVKLLGYTKVTRTVVVPENTTTTVDVALESTATPLNQVVVTGTVVATELKAIPSAITVITAKQIEERGITRIQQLFHGDVPGLFAQNIGNANALDEVTMFSRGTTALSPSSAGTDIGTNPIKTYIDGVELADPKYLSQIDPRSIERIEVLSGPQASTIYGSNAINGVMQIFTKRGTTSKPQLSLSLLSGLVQNDFSSARTPQHDYSAQLSGVEGRVSYNAGGSWNYIGPWTPSQQMTRTGGFGGARLELPTSAARVTADMTLRRIMTQSRYRGSNLQTFTRYRETGWYSYDQFSPTGLSAPGISTLTGQTLGLVLGYAPTGWWSHELGWGVDRSDTESRLTARGYASIADTALRLNQTNNQRRSFRYSTTARVPVTSFAQATITAGADAWQNLDASMYVISQTLTGTLTGTASSGPVPPTSVSRQPGHNTGGFLQTQLAVQDRLFLTYGLRAEWNPGYGEEAQPNYAPRYGVAFTQEVGPITAKLRGSYGRSTRPPQAKLKVAKTVTESYQEEGQGAQLPYILPYWGNFDLIFANPELGPEYQQGGEGGLELYLGTRASLVITRYNQTVDRLISSVGVDSVDLLPEARVLFGVGEWDPDWIYYQNQYLNIGSIRNQGWELQGSMNLGPITTRGTYSWTKSRVIGITPKYRAFFANQPQYQPGATFQWLPEHTWALGFTYARASTTVGLNVTGTGRVTDAGEDEFSLQNFDENIRLPQNRLRMRTSRYVNFHNGYALADLTASHRFAPHLEGVLQIQNLADHYTNDANAAYATVGRQGKIGFRIRL